MNKIKILDEFYQGRFCGWCKTMTEHLVRKIDEEGDGRFIGQYAECMNCHGVEDIEYKENNQWAPQVNYARRR